MIHLAVLLSGRGSNFTAIHQAIFARELDAKIVCVISNRPDAPGIVLAREWGYNAHVVDHKKFADRSAHEDAVLEILGDVHADFIALAGYMRFLSSKFLATYENRIVNIHPSLLPSFPGVDAQQQAVDYGVKVSGCTVHFVDENLDAGPIIVQRAVEVLPDDTGATLAARILEQEHIAYVEALRILARGNYAIEGRRVVLP